MTVISLASPHRVWSCPECDETIIAIATEVGHRCKMARNRWVAWDCKGATEEA